MIQKITGLGYEEPTDYNEVPVPRFLRKDVVKIALSGLYHGMMSTETEYESNADGVRLRSYTVWQRSCCDPHDDSGNINTLSALLFSKKDGIAAYIWRPDLAHIFGRASSERFWTDSRDIRKDIENRGGDLIDRVYEAVKRYEGINVVQLTKVDTSG